MTELCKCGKHRFNITFTECVLVCPVCGKEYDVFVDADDDGNLIYEMIETVDSN